MKMLMVSHYQLFNLIYKLLIKQRVNYQWDESKCCLKCEVFQAVLIHNLNVATIPISYIRMVACVSSAATQLDQSDVEDCRIN